MEPNSHPHEEDSHEVTIQVNEEHPRIERGRQTVVAIKQAGHVPLADDLVEVVNKKPVPLPDDGSVAIKGGERFISHPKGSGSS